MLLELFPKGPQLCVVLLEHPQPCVALLEQPKPDMLLGRLPPDMLHERPQPDIVLPLQLQFLFIVQFIIYILFLFYNNKVCNFLTVVLNIDVGFW
ncbi:hypothetical protein DWZ69_01630 [Eubacterium sp. AF34-35BH]|nr:hypothetical protein DWZ69_01630 [Eubacterium sp. AF34-35BH]